MTEQKVEARNSKFEDEEDIIGKILCKIQEALGLAGPNIQGYFV
jgi:hypothetical protein